jgi:hypothetical protein
MSGELERFRVDKIDVRGGNGEDDTVRLRNVFGDEVARLLFDVCWLIANRNLLMLASPSPGGSITNLGQTRQIDQCQAEDVWRVDLQIDGLAIDALVIPCYPRCLRLNFTLNLGEVVHPPTRHMKKFPPFILSCYACRSMRNVYFIAFGSVFAVAGKVDELQN